MLGVDTITLVGWTSVLLWTRFNEVTRKGKKESGKNGRTTVSDGERTKFKEVNDLQCEGRR